MVGQALRGDMLRNLILIGLALIVLSVIGLNCTTFYCKQFVVSGTPRYPNEAIRARGLYWFVKIDAEPTNRVQYCDSIYRVNISVSRAANETCDDGWRVILRSMELREFVICFAKTKINETEYLKLKDDSNISTCTIRWRFEPVIIPDSMDTILVNLMAEYVDDTGPKILDTTISLVRLTEKALDVDD